MFTNKRKSFRKALSLVLAGSIAVGGLSLSGIDSYGYYSSLLGIESIKTVNSPANPYSVLEIVPDVTAGTMEYYFQNGGDSLDWQGILSAKSNKTEREEYIEDLSMELEEIGLASRDKMTPLRINNYIEYYPWENESKLSGVYEIKQTKDSQPHFSSESIPDRFVEVTSGTGAYVESSGYEIATGESSAQYYLNPIYLEKVDEAVEDSTNYYFSDAGFTQYDFSVTGNIIGIIGKTFYQLDSDGVYQLVGTIIDGGELTLTPGETYYTHTLDPLESQLLSTTWSEDTPYIATKTEYVDATGTEYTPHYKLIERSYTYVGPEFGDYAYDTTISADGNVVVKYDSIFVPDIFSSNNWFAQYTLDIEHPEITPFLADVTSVVTSDLTVAMIEEADLIVFSDGYSVDNIVRNPNDGDVEIKEYQLHNSLLTDDIRAALVDATIPNAEGTNALTPIIFTTSLLNEEDDKTITDIESYLQSVNDYVAIDSPHLLADIDDSVGYVYQHVYAFGEYENDDVTPEIEIDHYITDQFATGFQEDTYKDNNSPFYTVMAEITEENLLRRLSGLELLPEVVSIATNTRAILNSGDTRIVTQKEHFNVLQIQPIRSTGNTTIDSDEINSEKVAGWLAASGVTKDMVTVNTMSISEFIGRIEEITEIYDMIYIGASTEGFNLYNNHPNYNDPNMNGMYYTNIGDIYNINSSNLAAQLGGMLNTDYSATLSGGYYPITNHIDARTSGFDLTAPKLQDLVDFAASGYPIIISDKLMETGYIYHDTPVTTNPLNVSISGTGILRSDTDLLDNTGLSAIELKATLTSADGEDVTDIYTNVSYQWYYEEGRDPAEKFPDDNVISSGGTTSEAIASGKDSLWIADNKGKTEIYCDITYYDNNSKSYITVSSNVLTPSNKSKTDRPDEYVRGWQFPTSGGAPTIDVINPLSIVGMGNTAVDENHVDNSSIMYEFLDGVKSLENVFTLSTIEARYSDFYKYANLSKPVLNLISQPKSYTDLDDYGDDNKLSSLISNRTLSYTFTIDNPTDPTPQDTKYRADLMIEQNSDGRFDPETELLKDLTVRETATHRTVAHDDLTLGVEYTLTKQLPISMSGAINWKLSINVIGNEKSHCSASGITYQQMSAPTEIKVLQILPENEVIKDNALYNISSYSSMFEDLKNAGMYDIKVEAIYVTDLNAMPLKADASPGATNLEDYLENYNMLFVGFGEAYGYRSSGNAGSGKNSGGFDLESAIALGYYIDSGRAVLFTHDVTSIVNVPTYNYPISGWSAGNLSNSYHFGFYFNTILRDAIGLDRYGVMSHDYGISDYSIFRLNKYITSGKNYVGNSYKNATADIFDELIANGYSIAYKPGSAKEDILDETQGFATHTIARYSNDGLEPTSGNSYSGGNNATSAVSQVNKGLITSYPYNINLAEFGGTGEQLYIAPTHEQYYQLNMNQDDVVVWYALSGSNYKNHHNDAANAYYIYNIGNVTYSGAGHSDMASSSGDEAKLFVNTIIAAYRVAITDISIEFSDEDGAKIQNKFIPVIEGTPGEFSGQIYTNKTGSAIELPFQITDDNLATNKTNTITLFFGIDGDNLDGRAEQSTLNIHKDLNGLKVPIASGENIVTGVQYYMYIPESMLSALYGGDENKLTLQLNLKSEITKFDGTKETKSAKSEDVVLYEMLLHQLV